MRGTLVANTLRTGSARACLISVLVVAVLLTQYISAAAYERFLVRTGPIAAYVPGDNWCRNNRNYFTLNVTLRATTLAPFRNEQQREVLVRALREALSRQCPKARTLRFRGYVGNTHVYTGAIGDLIRKPVLRTKFVAKPRESARQILGRQSAPHNPPPSVRRKVAAASPQDSGRIQGVWKGRYVCRQGSTGLTLTITGSNPSRLTARFKFYPLPSNPRVPSGEFELTGRFDPAVGDFSFTPKRWIKRPGGFSMIGLKGLIQNSGQELRGSITTRGCRQFELTRASGQAEQRVATAPSRPDSVPQSLLKAKSLGEECEALLAWLQRIRGEYPNLDLQRTVLGKIYPKAANLYRDEFFAPVFGRPYDQTTKEFRLKFHREVVRRCYGIIGNERRFRQRFAAFGPLLDKPFTSERGSFGYDQVAAAIAERRTLRGWMERTLAVAKTMPGTPEGFNRLDRYLRKGRPDLAALWPSETKEFQGTLNRQIREVASAILKRQIVEIGRLDESLDTARQIAVITKRAGKYLSKADNNTKSAFRRATSARLNEILKALVQKEIIALQALTPSLSAAGQSVRWREDFERTYKQFGGATAVKQARRTFETQRNELITGARSEFMDRLSAIPENQAGLKAVVELLEKTFVLPSDESLPVYSSFRSAALERIASIRKNLKEPRVAVARPETSNPQRKTSPEHEKRDAAGPNDAFARFEAMPSGQDVKDDALSRLQTAPRSSAEFPTEGYQVPGLMAAIYAGDHERTPDDKDTRGIVVSLFKRFNQYCGEAPPDVAFAAIEYGSEEGARVLRSRDPEQMARPMAEQMLDLFRNLERRGIAGLEDHVKKRAILRTEGLHDGELLIRNFGCNAAAVQRFRVNLHRVIKARKRLQPHPADRNRLITLMSPGYKKLHGIKDRPAHSSAEGRELKMACLEYVRTSKGSPAEREAHCRCLVGGIERAGVSKEDKILLAAHFAPESIRKLSRKYRRIKENTTSCRN